MLLTLPLAVALAAAATRRPDPTRLVAFFDQFSPDLGAADLAPDVPRVAPDPEAAIAGAAAIRGFTADFYRALALAGTGQTNVVCSPYSVAVALAMTRTGARGTTAAEMDATLHAPTPVPTALNAGLNALDQLMVAQFRDHGGDGSKLPRLAIANALWPQSGLGMLPAFVETLAAYYGATVHPLDFARATEEARRTINTWVSGNTCDKIPELLKRGMLTAQTALVLTNAMYLRASWQYPFDPERTRIENFTRDDGTAVPVPTMSAPSSEIGYLAGDGWTAVDVPYVGSQLAMAVVLPKPGGLPALEKRVDAMWLTRLLTGFRPRDILLRLPKWTFRLPADLNELLGRLGMRTAFTAGADFSGITADARLFISRVVHETFISVDEKGTEAAAATAVIMEKTGIPRPIEVVANRPFLYVIHDVATGTPLFIGRVGDPAVAAS